MKSTNRSGWYNESYRHYLASKGVTSKMYAYKRLPLRQYVPTRTGETLINEAIGSDRSKASKLIEGLMRRENTLKDAQTGFLLGSIPRTERELQADVARNELTEQLHGRERRLMEKPLSAEEKSRVKKLIASVNVPRTTESTLWREWNPDDTEAAIAKATNELGKVNAELAKVRAVTAAGHPEFSLNLKFLETSKANLVKAIDERIMLINSAQGNINRIPVNLRNVANRDVRNNPQNMAYVREVRAQENRI